MKFKNLLFIILAFLSINCSIKSIATGYFVDTLAKAETELMKDKNYKLLEKALPSFIVLVEATLADSPDNIELLLKGSKLHILYAFSFIENKDPKFAALHYQKAKKYLLRILKLKYGINYKDISQGKIEEVRKTVEKIPEDGIPYIFWLGMSWGGYVNTNRDDTECLANVPYVEILMDYVIKKQGTFENGYPHIFLGVFHSASSLTGDKEKAEKHFQKALTITNRKMYMVQLLYAKTFAKTYRDKELYENLLEEIINNMEEKVTYPEKFSLSNFMAYDEAKKLLDNIDEVFPSLENNDAKDDLDDIYSDLDDDEDSSDDSNEGEEDDIYGDDSDETEDKEKKDKKNIQ